MSSDGYQQLLALARWVAWSAPPAVAAPACDAVRPSLPDALARTSSLAFLHNDERLVLDRARAAVHLELVTKLEVPLVARLVADVAGLPAHEALREIADDERRHAALFARIARELSRCVGGSPEVAAPPLPTRAPLARAIALLHVDTLAQVHHLACVRAGDALEPCFSELMRLHWIEEVQHALVDRQVIADLAFASIDRDAAVAEYLDWTCILDDHLHAQAARDLDVLARATGRVLGERERDRALEVQRGAYRATFVGAALAHPALQEVVAALSPSRLPQLTTRAEAFL